MLSHQTSSPPRNHLNPATAEFTNTISSKDSGIHAHPSPNGKGLMVEVIGKLNWNQSQVFTASYQRSKKKESIYEYYMVDMSRCSQVTPGGICALLLLKEFADKHQSKLQIANTHIKMARQIRHADTEHQLSDVIKIDPRSML